MANPSIIPDVFASRKRRILAELSIPDTEYTDLSPKGSVDEGIRDLIDEINGLSGLVTTSSCAGRISVFLEGRRPQQQQERQTQQQQQQQQQQQEDENQQGERERERRFAPSGGKGAGKWLYVSHEPLQTTTPSDASDKHKRTLHELFGMLPGGDGKPPRLFNAGIDSPNSASSTAALRLVRFHFEPMILHIMAATLGHAQPVLAAASSSGFRESGLQSLRCLDGDDGSSPIVAVRSSGLTLESIIGYCESSSPGEVEGEDKDKENDDEPVIRSLVSEEYLRMLVALSNERFSVNTERKERFRASLMDLYSRRHNPGTTAKENKVKAKGPDWEDAETRRARKRAEGLRRKQQLERRATSASNEQNSLEEEVTASAGIL